MEIRTRIPPSPTGFMHIATLWTGLYNYLFAKKHGGKFILRIEDTDRTRFVEGATEDIIKTFAWAGINFDEGPTMDGGEVGDYGPYTQSKRLHIYKEYVEKLLAAGHAYWCECTEERLTNMRAEQELAGTKPGYDGLCRKKNLKSGLVVRLNVPLAMERSSSSKFSFDDLIRGKIEIDGSEIDDQVLLKSDGFPTYHLAVVVDDHLMKISHVIRGEEWISSTPKHILLYRAFGWDPPQFAHLPLLLNADRTKLSKRKGDVAVRQYIEKGYLPEAILNFIALQGFNPSGDREIYTVQELMNSFDLAKINKSGSVVNYEKLDWLNGHYIREKSDEELAELCAPYLPEGIDHALLKKIVAMCKDRLAKLSDITEQSKFIFELPEYPPELLVWKKSTPSQTADVLALLTSYCATLDQNVWTDAVQFETSLLSWIGEQGLGNGEVLWPLRVALSGQQNSPPPFAIAVALGKNASLERIEIARRALPATL